MVWSQGLTIFFISKEILPFVLSCTIGNILVSFHIKVTLNLAPSDKTKQSPWWRLNSSLLQDAFKAMLKTKIDLFIETYIISAPSAGTMWEVFKASIRGHEIQFSSHQKKKT